MDGNKYTSKNKAVVGSQEAKEGNLLGILKTDWCGMMSKAFFTLVIVASLFVAITTAEDVSITSADGSAAATIYGSGESHYAINKPYGGSDMVVFTTQLDETLFVGQDKIKADDGNITYVKSDSPLGDIIPGYSRAFPSESVNYSFQGDKLEQTVWLSHAHNIQYTFELSEKQYLQLTEDGAGIFNTENDPSYTGYIAISLPIAVDNNGQQITNFTYSISEDGKTLRMNWPDTMQGDDGNDISFPVSVDPIIYPKYYIVTILHNNLEAQNSFATTPPLDSSPKFKTIRFNTTGTSGAKADLNTTQKLWGNASAWFANGANMTVDNSNSDSDYTLGTNNFTICTNIRWTTAPGAVNTYYRYKDGSNYDYLAIVPSSNYFKFFSARGAVDIGSPTYTMASPFAAGIWYQTCVRQNGTTTQLYLNGTAVGAPVTRTGSRTALVGGSGTQFFQNAVGSSQFADEIIISNGADIDPAYLWSIEYPLYLNASSTGQNLGYGDDNSTVALLHMDGSNGGTYFKDEIGNRTWTVTAAITNTSQYKFGPSSGWFDGSSGYITAQPSKAFNFTTGQDFTIEFWYNTQNTGTGTIFGDSTQTATSYQIFVDPDGTNTHRILIWSLGTYVSTGFSGITNNNWHHFAWVRSSGVDTYYLDGVKSGVTRSDTTTYVNNVPTFGRQSGTWYYKGSIDEFRISNTSRWTANFTPPTYAYGLTDPSFSYSGLTTGNVPINIQFNSTTPDDSWSTNSWYWDFGDGSTSTAQNPLHTYSTAGIWNASLQSFNNNMSAVSDVSQLSVGAPVVSSSCTPRTGTAAMLVTCTHTLTNATPITAWNLSYGYLTGSSPENDLSGPIYSSGNGQNTVWTSQHVYANFGSYAVNFSATNSVGTGSFKQNDYIVTSTPQNTQNTWWSPHQCQLTISDIYSQRLEGVSVSARFNESTVPLGYNGTSNWLSSLYTVQNSPAADMTNRSLYFNGTTGSDGTLTFTVLGTLKYDFTLNSVAYGLSDYQISAYCADNMINAYVVPNGQTLPTNSNSTYVSLNGTRNYNYKPDVYNISLCTDYIDTTSETTSVNFSAWFPSNGSIFNSTVINNPTAGTTYTVCHKAWDTVATKGTEYLWGFNASRSVVTT